MSLFGAQTLQLFWLLAFGIIYSSASSFRLASYYSSHMVLQMEPSSAVVWGYSDMGANITLGFKEKLYQTEAQTASFTAEGVWRVTLDPQPPSGPFTIKVTSNNQGVQEVIQLEDVLFGDVWVCSGQSNMAFDVKQAFNGSVSMEQSYQYTDIRVLSVFQNDSAVPYYDIPGLYKPWARPDPDVLGKGAPGFLYFSALCWFYGVNLYNHLKYPIGLVSSNWGGTPVEDWSSPDVLAKCNVYKHSILKREKDNLAIGGPHDHSGLWNAMIHPMINMTIKGAIWYQGEANTPSPSSYKCLFPTMIEDWRDKWYQGTGGQTNPSFPFGFVQLCTSSNPVTRADENYTALRWHQTVDFGFSPNPHQPNVFMAVAVDLPDLTSPYEAIHPRYKQDVANRLTLGARAVAYGEGDVVYQGPFPTAVIRIASADLLVEFDDGKDVLRMNNASGFDACCNLSAEDCPLVGISSPWKPVTSGYELGKAHIFFQDPCTAIGERASMVRYNWRDMPCTGYKNCQLYDAKSNLPVPPFIKAVEDGSRLRPKLKFSPSGL
ncbi:sialate O-acetylesterase [Strongylocentrotus purpuratus]|uniref:Sialate O-acetylesterase domain-containing protein n=1 Tax=Strongylocentrotus purpuratus TaxID=7668 RepID=A0A7M7N450_STRPU|nr:sialate O-acetylesterase [Strongylocentrotus purpuratus]